MGDAPNWVAAIPFLVMATICLLWGGDLVLTAWTAVRPWWRVPWRSGSFWLGQFFVTIAVGVFGAIGVMLLAEPHLGVAPGWAILAVVAATQGTVAWWLLTYQTPETERDDAAD